MKSSMRSMGNLRFQQIAVTAKRRQQQRDAGNQLNYTPLMIDTEKRKPLNTRSTKKAMV
jgi:hypothetical protein